MSDDGDEAMRPQGRRYGALLLGLTPVGGTAAYFVGAAMRNEVYSAWMMVLLLVVLAFLAFAGYARTREAMLANAGSYVGLAGVLIGFVLGFTLSS